MKEALKEAEKALESGEVPVGAVVVCQNRIIARGYNQTENLQDATAHAEMIAMTAASGFLGTKYLSDCSLYVTLEPCSMCAGAIFWAQLGKLVFGADDLKRGYRLVKPILIHPKTKLVHGLLSEESKALLQRFFDRIRN